MSKPVRRFSATKKIGGANAVGFVLRGHRWSVAKIALTSFLGGAAEATFLITIARVAFAISDRQDQINIVSRWHLSLMAALLVALGLVALRLGQACYTNWQSAELSAVVIARVRQRLSSAFLSSAWEVQQAQPSGSLQALLTGHSRDASALMGSVNQGVMAGASLVALLAMAVAVNPVGAVVLVVSVTFLGLLLRPLRSFVRRKAQASTVAGMDFAISLNEVSELGLELHVFHVQDKAQARVGEAIERARKTFARLQFATGLSTPLYSGLAYLAILGALAIVAVSKTTSFASLGATMLVMLRSLSYGQAVQGAYVGISGSIPPMLQLLNRRNGS